MKWYLEALEKYTVFNGRARRKEYWYFFLFNVIFLTLLMAIDAVTGGFSRENGLGLLSTMYAIAMIIPSIAISIRRLHDTGLSGWCLLIGLVPIIGTIIVLILMMIDSDQEHNKFGRNPKLATT